MFIVIDGVNGVGKSTQVKRLAERLREMGRDVITTSEPFDKDVRDSLKRGEFNPGLELAMVCTDRVKHVLSVIVPAFRDGKDVICERYFYSTFVYQELSRDLPDHLLGIVTAHGTYPDIAFILDSDSKCGEDRSLFQIFALENPDVILVNADRSTDDITDEIVRHITQKLVVENPQLNIGLKNKNRKET